MESSLYLKDNLKLLSSCMTDESLDQRNPVWRCKKLIVHRKYNISGFDSPSNLAIKTANAWASKVDKDTKLSFFEALEEAKKDPANITEHSDNPKNGS